MDAGGHQLPQVIYPGILDEDEMMEWVARFYDEYYFRPKAAFRILRKAIFRRTQAPVQGCASTFLKVRSMRNKLVKDNAASNGHSAKPEAPAETPQETVQV